MKPERHKVRVAVYALLMRGNEIFLIRRKNTGWMDGNFGLPAGHLEEGEMLLQATVREVQEEAGIDVSEKDLRFVHLMHRNLSDNSEYIDVFFEVKIWQGEPRLNEPDMADEAAWFDLDHLPENIVPSVREVIGLYREGTAFSETTLH